MASLTMRVRSWLLLLALAGCNTQRPALLPDNLDPHGSGADVTGTHGGSCGLPCDVDQLLARECRACHSAPRSGGATLSLVAYGDLTKPIAGRTVAEIAVDRTQLARSPMPPTGLLPDAVVKPLSDWVAAGMPTGTCGGANTDRDPAFSGPTLCSSGQTKRGERGRETMHPGGDCNGCHDREGQGPTFSIAGTVYATGHQSDDCIGAAGAGQVIITDMAGTTLTLTPNASGNFTSTARLVLPYAAKVVYDGRERQMATPQTEGSCNNCHSEQGTHDAPGRIALP